MLLTHVSGANSRSSLDECILNARYCPVTITFKYICFKPIAGEPLTVLSKAYKALHDWTPGPSVLLSHSRGWVKRKSQNPPGHYSTSLCVFLYLDQCACYTGVSFPLYKPIDLGPFMHRHFKKCLSVLVLGLKVIHSLSLNIVKKQCYFSNSSPKGLL